MQPHYVARDLRGAGLVEQRDGFCHASPVALLACFDGFALRAIVREVHEHFSAGA
jgi:hypothetical protein